MGNKKKWAVLLSILFAIVIFFPFDAFSAMKGTVTADVLNVRSTNSLNGEIIGTVKKNTQLTIVKETGDWLEIQFQSKRAYVNKQYVKYPINQTNTKNNTTRKVTIYVNDQQLTLPTEPINHNSRLLLPYRKLADSLGIHVEWNQSLRQVTATENGKNVILTIDKKEATVNGQKIQMDVAPIIVNSSTLVPLRFFSEAFDAEVKWDDVTRTVTINRAIVQPPVTNPIEETDLIGTVTASVLNVRSGPSTDASKIGELTRGAKINIIEINGDWIQFHYQNQLGYVHKNYVHVQQQLEEQVPINPVDVLKNRTIIVDPGHGGSDPGTVHNGLREKDIVLKVGLILENKLKASGANVVMTRRDDSYVSLEQRSNIANTYQSDTFVSIHVNAVENIPTANGTETYWNRTYASEESRKLAQAIQKQLIEKLQTKDRGVKEANFYVIRHTKSPSVLVELGFLSNKDEAKRLNDPAFQELAAQAIFEGLVEYYSK